MRQTVNRVKRAVKNPLRRKKNLRAVERQGDLERKIQLYNARVAELDNLEEAEKARAQVKYAAKVGVIKKEAALQLANKEKRARREKDTEIEKIQSRYASKRSDFQKAKANAQTALNNVRNQTARRNAQVLRG
jgi:hypothetical protein